MDLQNLPTPPIFPPWKDPSVPTPSSSSPIPPAPRLDPRRQPIPRVYPTAFMAPLSISVAPVKMIVAEIVPDTETPTNPMLHFQKMSDVQKKSATQRRRYLFHLVTKLIFFHFLINTIYCSYIFSAFSLCHPDLNKYQLLAVLAGGFCSLRILYILFIAIRALQIWRFNARSIDIAEEIQSFFLVYSGLFLALPEGAVIATSFSIVSSPHWVTDMIIFGFGQIFLYFFMTLWLNLIIGRILYKLRESQKLNREFVSKKY